MRRFCAGSAEMPEPMSEERLREIEEMDEGNYFASRDELYIEINRLLRSRTTEMIKAGDIVCDGCLTILSPTQCFDGKEHEVKDCLLELKRQIDELRETIGL